MFVYGLLIAFNAITVAGMTYLPSKFHSRLMYTIMVETFLDKSFMAVSLYIGLNSQSDGQSIRLSPALMTSITVRSITKSGKRKLPLESPGIGIWSVTMTLFGTILAVFLVSAFHSASTCSKTLGDLTDCVTRIYFANGFFGRPRAALNISRGLSA